MEQPSEDRPTTSVSGPVGAPVVREEGGPASVPEAEVFRFDQVDRAGGRLHGPGTRRGLTLDFDAGGIEVFGPRTGRRQTIRWSEVAWIAFDAPVLTPDGRSEAPIDVESSAGLVRYVVKSDDSLAVVMAALEIQVARWTSAERDAPDRAAAPEPAVRPVPPPPPGWTLLAPPSPPPGAPPPPVPFSGTVPYPVPSGVPSGYGPPAPAGFDTTGPIGPHELDSTSPFGGSDPAVRHPANKRSRRTVVLVVAIAFVVAGVGLGVGLAATGTTPPAHKVAVAPAPSADQRLAEQLLLTKSDLPAGWRPSTNPGTNPNSPALRQGEARITTELARCMGVSDAEGAIVLGGQATDQTAQTSSPIFVAPSAAAGTAVELQTAATVVRSHQDEQQDLALFANPKYPQCAATASAEELQLGVNQTSGGGDQAGPATATPVDLPGVAGVQLSGVLMDFTVVDGTATVHVQVESIALGAHRVEAGMEVFALGGQIPSQSLSAAVTTFEQRVASGGASSVV